MQIIGPLRSRRRRRRQVATAAPTHWKRTPISAPIPEVFPRKKATHELLIGLRKRRPGSNLERRAGRDLRPCAINFQDNGRRARHVIGGLQRRRLIGLARRRRNWSRPAGRVQWQARDATRAAHLAARVPAVWRHSFAFTGAGELRLGPDPSFGDKTWGRKNTHTHTRTLLGGVRGAVRSQGGESESVYTWPQRAPEALDSPRVGGLVSWGRISASVSPVAPNFRRRRLAASSRDESIIWPRGRRARARVQITRSPPVRGARPSGAPGAALQGSRVCRLSKVVGRANKIGWRNLI